MGADGFEAAEQERRRSLLRHVVGFGAMLLLAICLCGVTWNMMVASQDRRAAGRIYIHTMDVLLSAENLRSAIHAALRGEQGYMLTGDRRFLGNLKLGLGEIPVLQAKLHDLTKDNPAQQRNLRDLDRQLVDFRSGLIRLVDLKHQGKMRDAIEIIERNNGKSRLDAMFDKLTDIENVERRLLAIRRDNRSSAIEKNELQSYALAVVALLLLAVTARVALSASRGRRRMLEMAELLRISATTDELTGLANRRVFMEALGIEVERARRGRRSLSIALIDVDHFKKVNDTHGHQCGDEVLKAVARIAQDTMRAGDVVGRLGGEEFAVLMPDSNLFAAQRASERLREAIADHDFELSSGAHLRITLSSGVALLVEGEEQDNLVKRADEALYSAKASGRNQVRLAWAA